MAQLLRHDVAAQLAQPSHAQGIADARALLVAASVDPLHDASLPGALSRAQGIVERSDTLLRNGLPLSTARLKSVLPDAELDPAVLEGILTPGGQPRSALLRALDASLALGDTASADLVSALVLGSAGLLHRLHFLPFSEADGASRADAHAAAEGGDSATPTRLLLAVAAESARVRRMAIEAGMHALADDAARLAPLGRAAITARRALDTLRQGLAATMPSLSTALDCSRPAAGDALERLVDVGLAREITGRGRDRVYVDALAWDVPPA